ncbi:MAG TPA: YihY/virulence factor BrkB family protein [Actinomycetales bacterium]|nr:YihY/virulence factor BrkB family protein [Actinomycetales bacterium]
MDRLRALVARAKTTHGYRAWDRYGEARGNVLAGGVAYLAFFSIVPALVLGFAVFGFVLRGQPDLFDRVVSAISDTLPGIVKDAAHPKGLIDATRPPTPNALTITGAISVVVLLLSGLGWLAALRQGVRAVFGRPRFTANVVTGKLRDIGVMAVLGLAFLLSGVLSTGVSSAARWLLGQLSIGSGSFAGGLLLRALAVLVVFIVDVLLMLVVFRLLSGLRLPREDLLQGAVLGAVGLGVLKLASGLLLASAAKKPVIGAFAVIIGLLVLLNLISRVVLLASAWAATTAEERGRLQPEAPVSPPAAVPLGPREALLPTFGQRAADRTTLAAGAALGLTAALVVRTAGRGVRAAAAAVRGR